MKSTPPTYKLALTGTRAIVSMYALGLWAVGCDRDSELSSRTPPDHDERNPASQLQPADVATSQGASSPREPAGTASEPSARGSAEPAASGATGPMPPASKAGPAKERDVRKFAQAYSAIQVINTQYSPMITAAPTTEQARAVQQAANRATTMAILEAGLNQSRYSEIADAVQRDASLRQAFLDEVEAQESAGDESAAEGAP